jgi:hypothetical protein
VSAAGAGGAGSGALAGRRVVVVSWGVLIGVACSLS